MSKPRVLLIGGLPRPSGGVTVFLGRLVQRLGTAVAFDVLDIHAGEKEPNLAVRHRIAPPNRWLRHIWLLWHAAWSACDVIHFNYSSGTSVLALAFVPKRGRRFVLTLHNGTQPDLRRAFPGAGAVLRHAVAKLDVVLSLCRQHDQFYAQIGVEPARISSIKSQIPPQVTQPRCVDEVHRALRAGCKSLVVSSGHVARSYQFEFLIRYVNAHPKVGGLLFLYGADQDREYLLELQALVQRPGSVLFYFHQPEAVFLAALATSDAYLRPSTVDSWGIAVADAISSGKPAIASNVCERSPGALLCDANDYATFFSLVTSALTSHPMPPPAVGDFSDRVLCAYRPLPQQEAPHGY